MIVKPATKKGHRYSGMLIISLILFKITDPNIGPLKLFVGGLRGSVTNEDLKAFAETYGVVEEAIVMYVGDHSVAL